MGESTATNNHHHQNGRALEFPVNMPSHYGSKVVDDDGRPQRTGTVWTASAHIITAVIGSGVLSLAWAIGQLGWIAGPAVMFLFSFVIYYTSTLLSDCYRSGDPLFGKRNYTYMDAVRSSLGEFQVKLCGLIQYLNIFGVAIGYTIAAAISMMAIKRSNCFHKSGGKDPCAISSNPYMIAFGVTQILFSQIPDFDQIWWLSIVAAIMSFTYSSIGLGLGVAQVAANGSIKGSLTGISVGTVTETQKIWRSFQALGDIAFAYSFSIILIEIQDTVKSPPSEAKTMKKATLISTIVTTIFYMLCGCMGYAAFGDLAPGNLLTGFGFYNPFWLLDIANAAIVIHLVGAYQVYCQPLFAFVEKWAAARWPDSSFISKEIQIPVPFMQQPYGLNLFRLTWRSGFAVVTTVISMLMPFFNDVVGILGAFGFWPLTVYYPVEMYIVQKKIPRWSTKWISLQMLSLACLAISIAAAAGSVAGVVLDLKVYRPFKTSY
ncbi:amino acid permease 3-like [Andrographis paniculata]|uniref:amino acid permease 3-like n=1 Tax=Andrographis paniculata TaxID=175694 RepID=UPI0021E7F85B|nr:amino acid permease 3-like [Andrographis paniculata]